MFVLRRRRGESVQIGARIKVTVLAVGVGRVKLGVSAPAEVEVWRAEVRGTAAPSFSTTERAIHAPATAVPRVQRRAITIGATENCHESEVHPA